MRVLLDTSIFLWFIAGSGKLSQKTRELMEDFDNELGNFPFITETRLTGL